MPGDAEKIDAVVVGSGPNGLTAAIFLARAGLRVRVYEAEPTLGGGVKSAELTLPGFLHDVCSAIHPMAVASPAFAELRLERHGLEWIQPDLPVAHPLDDGSAVVLARSLDETAAPLVFGLPELLEQVLRPLVRVPRQPLALARFGMRAVRSAASLARGLFEGAVSLLVLHASRRRRARDVRPTRRPERPPAQRALASQCAK